MTDGVELIAVDWGTTNRRVYAIGGKGRVLETATDNLGVLAVPSNGFTAEVSHLRKRFGDHPLLLAGMIGSDRGWVEVPYVPCPAGLGDLAAGLTTVDGLAAIVPGVADSGDGRADVMRGEEIQLLGAVADGLVAPTAVVCHPGTHAKWAKLRAGSIAEFRTIMTGELFSLLRNHGVLAPSLHAPVHAGDAFREGVNHALRHGELPADLFSVRARVLLGRLAQADAASYASGLLIGCDVRIGLRFVGAAVPVALIGDPYLTGLYAAALRQAQRGCREIAGEQAFVAGIRAVAERMS